ncbi:hypothetical protein FHS29_004582 [Saccharothrix tamanrassetensis]|uniref:Uncharacterized protein n=1 Tax=Saccharothrix tamanrassetensis TaxID=1051531 RepID=A0A841CNN2_9PSEU|nr:hypothetical protein [Saccharothrix tamanrassetensis]MBB5957974.1 hypothetical protein [Saccharothrix tamanrassetensis]
MPRVVVRGSGTGSVVLRPGESLLFGRAPHAAVRTGPGRVALALPDCAPHVSRLVGELVVGTDTVTLHWLGAGEAQLSSLFDAPGGARRVILARSMSALLDAGENQLVLLLGRQGEQGFTDLVVNIDVEPAPSATPFQPEGLDTEKGPGLVRGGRDWFVALALCEPWLAGNDDYPRPPSNKEIFERVRQWHGYTWNLQRPQRVDDAIRAISAIAFGVSDDPFLAPHVGRLQNIRFAVARRAAETRLVTSADLAEVERAARGRKVPPPQGSPGDPAAH